MNGGLRFPLEILRARMSRLRTIMKEMNLDVAVIRTLSTFIYLTGVKWLRPTIIVPVDGEPVVFLAKGEEDGFKELSWIKNVETYVEGGEVMRKVSGYLRELGVKRVGFEFGIEKDAYVFFFEMFKKLNPNVEVVDLSERIAEMRMFKDDAEVRYIREAGLIAKKAMEEVLAMIKPGIAETEIAAEAYDILYRLGSEEPHVYVNAGPHPRVHSEPLSTIKVREGTFVTIVIGADKFRYYANVSRSVFIGSVKPEIATRVERCTEEIYVRAIELTKPHRRFHDVINELDRIYERYDMKTYRVIGYVHGIGLQAEEPPITTIVPGHRFMKPKPRMVLAMVHSPILIPSLGQVKKEDTFLVKEDGELEAITV